MIWISFFRPKGVFEGSFNKLASWWTGGDFCHCELVYEVEPNILMNCVKNRYANIKNETKERGTIISNILEKTFFESRDNRKLLQRGKPVFVSFSLVWGDQLRVRFLMDVKDPWITTPNNQFEDLEWIKCEGISEKNETRGLNWALQEIGKPYNTSAAMFSWIPSWSIDGIRPKDSYFCSEFTAMVLIHMDYLKPMSVTDCTPNSLWKLLLNYNKKEIKTEEEEEKDSYAISSSDEEEEEEEEAHK